MDEAPDSPRGPIKAVLWEGAELQHRMNRIQNTSVPTGAASSEGSNRKVLLLVWTTGLKVLQVRQAEFLTSERVSGDVLEGSGWM